MSEIAAVSQSKTEVLPPSGTVSKSAGWLWPFLCLLLLEVVAFGLNVKNVGVYQDEWIYFGNLHFVEHTFGALVSALFWDPRIIVRPLEALHFGPIFFLAWEKPFLYHLVCYVTEFFGGWFLYLAVTRLVRSRAIALATAALFLLYPTHDASHYYITASGEQVSASFFTLSLWLFIKALDERRNWLFQLAAMAYFCSVYNYEQTLPLVVLYPLVTLLNGEPVGLKRVGFKLFVLRQLPFFLIALSMVIYRSKVLPALGLGWNYQTCFSLPNFMNVMLLGINVSLSPYLVSFCGSMIGEAWKEGLSVLSWVCLAFTVGAVFWCVSEQTKLQPAFDRGRCLFIVVLGLITIVCSYTIFGFSPEHQPVLDGWRNRVNVCGSLGASFAVAGILAILRDVFKSVPLRIRNIIFAALVSALCGSFVLVDWQFAKPWIISWNSQKQLMAAIKNHAAEIKPGDSIIIGGITRYVRWAPVVDGVWDFQNLVRTTLNDRSINANVITGRLFVTKDALEDRSGVLLLGRYPFKQMILYAPDFGAWERISSREEFGARAKRFGWSVKSDLSR
jgi:hypothetical protein